MGQTYFRARQTRTFPFWFSSAGGELEALTPGKFLEVINMPPRTMKNLRAARGWGCWGT
jgi:hypothetical protein